MPETSDKPKSAAERLGKREPPELQLLRTLDRGAQIDAMVDTLNASIPDKLKAEMAAFMRDELERAFAQEGIRLPGSSSEGESTDTPTSAGWLERAVTRFSDFAGEAVQKALVGLDQRFASAFQPALAWGRGGESDKTGGAPAAGAAPEDAAVRETALRLLSSLPDWAVVPLPGRRDKNADMVFAIIWKGEGPAPGVPDVRITVDGAALDPDAGYMATSEEFDYLDLPPGHQCVVFEALQPAGVAVMIDPEGTLLLDFQST